MAEAYSEEIREAAKILHLEGFNSREIRARMGEKRAGLPYSIRPSVRTIDQWRAKFKRDGIRAGLSVPPGTEDQEEEAGYRRLLAIRREVLLRLDESVQSGKPSHQWIKAADQLQSAVDRARGRRKVLAKRERGAKISNEEAAEFGAGNVDQSDLLESLAAEHQDQAGQDGKPGGSSEAE